jgi:hypothetical protein
MKRVVVIGIVVIASIGVVWPAVTQAMIMINRGMFGLSLGASMEQARDRFGRPATVNKGGTRATWAYPRRGIFLQFNGTRLITVATMRPGQRTSRGIGVGSSEQDVIAQVPGVHCVSEGAGAFCRVSSRRHGKTYFTSFEITPSGRVQSVAVGVLP